MSIRNSRLQVSVASAAALAVAGGLALPAYLSLTNIAWLAAFGVACGVALLVLRDGARPSRTTAQILYDTEHPNR
jgi:hypothetical protein